MAPFSVTPQPKAKCITQAISGTPDGSARTQLTAHARLPTSTRYSWTILYQPIGLGTCYMQDIGECTTIAQQISQRFSLVLEGPKALDPDSYIF